MATTYKVKSFTVRFPSELYQAASEAAAKNRKSLNTLLQQITEAYLREEKRQLFDSFSRLGENLAECDVEYAWDAQREAILKRALMLS